MSRYEEYDYVVINEDIDTSSDLLRSVVQAERAKAVLSRRICPAHPQLLRAKKEMKVVLGVT